ncbi:MAG: thioredoxin [Anaerolineales bacterium]|nr:thioredoxin [Anaerolineales bacterium]
MGQTANVIDVSQATFQQDVIQRSFDKPVVVDFWAPWCGPCRMLGPVLERLANEPGSGFLLAKLNSDQNQQITMQFGIRGIPAVKAFVNGRVVDEFVGAQPEARVRQFIQSLPKPTPQAQAKKQPETVSDDPQMRLQQAKKFLREGNGRSAQAQLSGLTIPEAKQMLPLAQFLSDVQQGRVNDSQLRQVADFIRRRDYGTAFYNLLVARQSTNGSRATDIMRGLFALLGDQDPMVQAYKVQLAS